MSVDSKSAVRPEPDEILVRIADYVCDYQIDNEEALETARYCLIDTLGCGLLALTYPACSKLLGPVVPGADLRGGARVPGTAYELDPVTAAFNIGCMIRWLDFNDTWLAAEWGHPSDNLGGILAVADWLSRQRIAEGNAPLTMRDVLIAMIDPQSRRYLQRWLDNPGGRHEIALPLAWQYPAGACIQIADAAAVSIDNEGHLEHPQLSFDASRQTLVYTGTALELEILPGRCNEAAAPG